MTRETSLETQPAQQRRRGRMCSRCWTRDSSAAHGAERGAADEPMQPKEIHRDAVFHLPWRSPMPEQVDAENVSVTPWEIHATAVSRQDIGSHGEKGPCKNRFPGRITIPWEGLRLE